MAQTPLIPMRPLGLGDTFESTLKVFSRGFKTFFFIGLLPLLPGLIIAALTLAVGGIIVTTFIASQDSAGIPISIGLYLLALILVGIFSLVMNQLVSILSAQNTVGTDQSGHAISLGRLFADRSIWKRAFGLTIASICVNVAIVVIFGIFAVLATLIDKASWVLIFIGVIVTVFLFVMSLRFLIAPSICAIENVSGFTAYRRAWEITKANMWRTIGYCVAFLIALGIVTGLCVSLIEGVLGFFSIGTINEFNNAPGSFATDEESLAFFGAVVSSMLASSLISTILGQIIAIISAPLQATFFAVHYLDVRRRLSPPQPGSYL